VDCHRRANDAHAATEPSNDSRRLSSFRDQQPTQEPVHRLGKTSARLIGSTKPSKAKRLNAGLIPAVLFAGLVLPSGAAEGITESGWTPAAPMSAPRAGHTATFLWGTPCTSPSPPRFCGKILVVGGGSLSAPLGSAEIFDPLNEKWTSTGSLLHPRAGHSALLLPNGGVMVDSGQGPPAAANTPRPQEFVEIYDPAKGAWKEIRDPQRVKSPHLGNIPSASALIAGSECGTICGKALLVLGDTAEIVDPIRGSIRPTRPPAAGGFFRSMLSLGNPGCKTECGGLLLTTHLASGPGPLSQIFDPSKETWKPTAPPPALPGHAQVLLANGRVLTAAGKNAEIFDGKTNAWMATGSTKTPRSSPGGGFYEDVAHFLVSIPGGEAMAVGGWDKPTADVETYSPVDKDQGPGAQGAWRLIQPLQAPRIKHAATLIRCGPQAGKVLVTGGMTDLAGPPVSTTEMYSGLSSKQGPECFHRSAPGPSGAASKTESNSSGLMPFILGGSGLVALVGIGVLLKRRRKSS